MAVNKKKVIKRNRNSPTGRISEINSRDLILKDEFQIANKFNEYFTSIGFILASEILQIDGNHLEFIQNDISNTIVLNQTNELEINSIVSTKSPGYGDISPKVIKAVIDSIHLPLCDIFNKSLQTGYFPDNLKIAKVVPIYKGDDKRL